MTTPTLVPVPATPAPAGSASAPAGAVPQRVPLDAEGSPGLLDRVSDWAVGLMDTLGAPGTGLAVALENLVPPVPSEVILPLAGFAAAQGRLALLDVLAWTTVGSLVGAVLLYGLGAALGRDRLRRVVDRMPLVRLEDLDTAEAWFARYGAAAVLVGRVVPLVRSLVSVPAGVERMVLWRFVLLTTVGSAVWNTALVLVGYALGERWADVERAVETYKTGVVVVLALLAAAYVGYAVRAAVRRRSSVA
ncbi:DedA family protein [Cellulomonas cellasea]|uniref:Membrane protein DedA with SNARE-associated domain n=1 Tax=Cellulomonas cellasea TaxID=43670 RepID=A0A7W4UFT3_9CELL|nr:DedA family protein [Cellulomonas cellasea]MBB2922758.1 membrane protein DedA with SNARE-associated domain [Cellulomonas cellasea]